MVLQPGALRTALLAAHVPEDQANAAAEEVATYESRFGGIDARLGRIEGWLDGIDARLGLMPWAVGVNVALTLAVLAKLFAQH